MRFVIGISLLFIGVFTVPSAVRAARDYPIVPVPFTDVQIVDGFWAPRLETNRTVTIPYDFKKCEETSRIDNFAVAGRLKSGEFVGIRYNDSDVYKIIEGAAYSLRVHPDPELDRYLDRVISLIAAAQEPDGYLYTCRTINPKKMPPHTGETRWSFLAQSHELYNVGHMYEAAVAHFEATGKRSLLDIALKNADLIVRTFGPGKDQLHGVPGHQEIEIGLCKLYRVTGEEKYLDQAKYFLEQRGNAAGHTLYVYDGDPYYAQDHKPVFEQEEAVGHSVRALYMYSGMADVAALTGDERFVRSLDRLWKNTVGTKTYVTGGVGSVPGGEAFGKSYELPNATAYSETCASIANIFWNYRMFLLHGRSDYYDVLERTLYNAFLAGVALGGDAFFYDNPLASDGKVCRSPWFECSCCPSNVVRFLPSLPGYIYAHRDADLFVNLFIGSRATVKMPGGAMQVVMETEYPWSEHVRIRLEQEKESLVRLRLRIPGWAADRAIPEGLYSFRDLSTEEPVIRVNGQVVEPPIEDGYATIARTWKSGDTVDLDLPMPLHMLVAKPEVADDRGRVAFQRGPIVFCAEAVDNGGSVSRLLLDPAAPFTTEFRRDMLSGVMTVRGRADVRPSGHEHPFLAVPYYSWAHREQGEMIVWLPVDRQSVSQR